MTAKNRNDAEKASTEEKIKAAAEKVFTRKGFAATRTRDIAEEAGINLALLNYYFRSKEKLFELVMLERLQKMFGGLLIAMNDDSTTLEKKVLVIVDHYISLLVENPDLPMFVLSEIRNNPERLSQHLQLSRLVKESHFVKQLVARRPDVNPVQFFASLLGMLVFPFLGRPILQHSGVVNNKQFQQMIEERRTLIPKWFSAIIKAK